MLEGLGGVIGEAPELFIKFVVNLKLPPKKSI
jgi:hypothetical protein